jgi:hypothetical protein
VPGGKAPRKIQQTPLKLGQPPATASATGLKSQRLENSILAGPKAEESRAVETKVAAPSSPATAVPPPTAATTAAGAVTTAPLKTKPAQQQQQPAKAKEAEKVRKEKPPKKGSEPVVAKKPIKTVEEAFRASAADRDYRIPYASGTKFIIKQAGKV